MAASNITLQELEAMLEERRPSFGSVFNWIAEDDQRVDAFWSGDPLEIEVPNVGMFTIQLTVNHHG